MREERRKVLKHEREMREIEEAYAQMMQPGYYGDRDIEHVIEYNRKRYASDHVDSIALGVPVVHKTVTHVPVEHQTTAHPLVTHAPVSHEVVKHLPVEHYPLRHHAVLHHPMSHYNEEDTIPLDQLEQPTAAHHPEQEPAPRKAPQPSLKAPKMTTETAHEYGPSHHYKSHFTPSDAPVHQEVHPIVTHEKAP